MACVLWVGCSPEEACKQELVECVLWVAWSPEEDCKQELVACKSEPVAASGNRHWRERREPPRQEATELGVY